MKYGLKTLEELGYGGYTKSSSMTINILKEGDLIVSITNNYKLTKGKTYIVEKSIYGNYVKNDKGEWCSDMALFVFECDWKKAIRDIKLRKLGI